MFCVCGRSSLAEILCFFDRLEEVRIKRTRQYFSDTAVSSEVGGFSIPFVLTDAFVFCCYVSIFPALSLSIVKFMFQKQLNIRIIFHTQGRHESRVPAFPILFAVQFKRISHNTLWIAVFRIDQSFTNRCFFNVRLHLFWKTVKKVLIFVYVLGINSEFHSCFPGNKSR